MNPSPFTKVGLIELINSVINLRANGRNVVGQQLPRWMLHVVSVCTPCYMLLHVAA